MMNKAKLKTHKYKILKTYTPKEIKSYGNAEFFYDKEVTDKKIKLHRAHVLNKVGYQCVEPGCNITGFHFGLGVDKGGGIHLDLYGYDKDGDLIMMTIDHIKPKAKGGHNHISNYATLCKIHNEIKAHNYNMNRQFKDLCLIYPNEKIESQNYSIYKKELAQEEIDSLKNEPRAIGHRFIEHFVPGKQHVILFKKDEGVMMSTHPSETITNQDFINQAFGDVLIFGLGLGMIVFPLLMDDDIKSITIVEYDAGVIDMVGKILLEHDYNKKVKIIQGDAFSFHESLTDERFDTIYFDIWRQITADSINEMELLHSLYEKFKKSQNASYINSWCYEFKNDYIETKND
ncbi:MAG: HNH endonuclease [Nanoarchaeota archaeon]